MAEDVHRGAFVTPAAEWLLDNFHLVASEILDVRRNLPAGLLPRAAQARAARAGGRRARLRHGRGAHPPQRQPPGPPAARALHEQLPGRGPAHHRRAVGVAEHAEAGPHREPAAARRGDPRGARGAAGRRRLRGAASTPTWHGDAAAAARATSTPPTSCSSSSACASTAPAWPRCAPPWTPTSRPSRRPRRTPSAASTSARPRPWSRWRTSITSLRLCATLDWSQYFEAVSLIERVLQRDPAGAYARMDFLSRDRYRQAVEQLSEPDPTGEVAAAGGPARGGERAPGRGERARRGSRRPRRPPPHRQGPPRPRDRPRLSSAPARAAAALRLRATRPASTSGSIALATASPGRASASPTSARRAAPPWMQALAALLLLLPASDTAIAFIQRLAARLVAAAAPPPPRVRGRDPGERAHDGGGPDPPDQRAGGGGDDRAPRRSWPSGTWTRTSTSRSSATSPTPPRGDMPGDEADPRRRPGRHRGPERAPQRGPIGRFYLFHRARQWNPGEGVWMGWERKRGKLEEFNRLLRGATDTSFTVQVGRPGDPARRPLLPHPRLRHAPAPRRRQEARSASSPIRLNRAALRSPRWAASPRATGSCSRG